MGVRGSTSAVKRNETYLYTKGVGSVKYLALGFC